MSTKKLISLAAAVMMVCLLVAGCGTASAATTGSALAPVTLSWYLPANPQKDTALVQDALKTYLADKINASIELNFVDWGSWGDKTNVMISSGESYDIMFTAGWSGFLNNVTKGAFLDITDMLGTYCPNTMAMMPQVYKDAVKVQGRSYGISTNKDLAHTWGIVYRSDITDKYGIDMSGVKTFADLGPVLAQVKQNAPDMIGIGMDMSNNCRTQTDFDPIIDQATPAKLYPAKDMTVVNEFATPEVKALLDTVRQYYQAGYIRTDAATLQDRRPDIADGKVFCVTTTLKPLVETGYMNGHPDQTWKTISFTSPFITNNDAQGSINAIGVTSKNPERALMFLELVNTDPVVNNMLNYGIENTHYVKVDANTIDFMPGQDATTCTYHPGADWEFGNQFLNYIYKGVNPDKWNLYKAFNESGKPSLAIGFSFDPTSVQTEMAAVLNTVNTYSPGLFTGSVDPSAVLPEFLDKLTASGLDKIIAEAQTQLDAWAKTK